MWYPFFDPELDGEAAFEKRVVADPVRVLPRRRFRQAVGDPEPIAVARGLRPDNRYIHSTAARSQAHHHLSVGGSEREESQSSITNRLTQGADLSQIFNS